jgi:hypothetical protein
VEPAPDAQPGDWADDFVPDWSPDGTRIAFTRVVYICGPCDQDEVFSVNVDGSDVRPVTTEWGLRTLRPVLAQLDAEQIAAIGARFVRASALHRVGRPDLTSV